MFKARSIIALAILISSEAFAPSLSSSGFRPRPLQSHADDSALEGERKQRDLMDRRSALVSTMAATFSAATLLSSTSAKAVDIRGTELNAFNGLAFNYRGSEYGGLDASTLNEPSIPYKDFLVKLSNNEVEFVEFLAPDGDAAYATFKAKEGEAKEKPIRIGEGFPIEQHDGWSSPAFVVRTLKEKGVPYKFTVPALAAYKQG